MTNSLATGVRLLANAAVLAAAGFVAYRWNDRAPLTVHGAVFAGGSVLAAVLVAFSVQVFAKFDKLLQDSEKFEYLRTAQIYRYVGVIRRRHAIWLVGALFCLFSAAVSAYLVKDGQLADLRSVIVAGYVSLAMVLLAFLRVMSAYLRLDSFRLGLFRAIENEKRRFETLRAMRPSAPIKEIPLVRAAEH